MNQRARSTLTFAIIILAAAVLYFILRSVM